MLPLGSNRSSHPVAGGFGFTDSPVQAARFANHYRIEIPDLDLECPSKVDHVLVRDPDKAGLDLRDTASGPLSHS
jgi:hypothetical protein